MDIFDSINLNERTKLILAYVVIPLFTFVVEYAKGRLDGLALPFILTGISFVCIPPTIIRFVVKTQGIEYLSEIFAYLLLSVFITFGTIYVIYSFPGIPSFLDVLSIYLILSYKSTRKKSSFKILNYPYWFAEALFGGIRYNIRHNIKNRHTALEAFAGSIISALILLSFLLLFRSNKSNEQSETEQKASTTTNDYNSNTKTFTNKEIYINLKPPQPDTADTLIDIGLAHIGRITALDNLYITPEQTQSRHNVERPFLQMLSERYMDNNTRKTLARHFMLYKEVTLFVIFAMVLKNDKPLLTKIHNRLKVLLSQGLPSKVIASRNEYWHKLSEKFNESYIQTHDLATTLDYVFWSVLPENLKGEGFADLTGNGYLKQIFDYAREAIAQEYKNIAR